MSNESSTIVRLWNYCNVLRDDGLSYGDYVEQLTYLLFLKMADEQTKPPFNKSSIIPEDLDWKSLLSKDGDALETHYRGAGETVRRKLLQECDAHTLLRLTTRVLRAGSKSKCAFL